MKKGLILLAVLVGEKIKTAKRRHYKSNCYINVILLEFIPENIKII
jgi:hypothetical protein